MELKAIMSVYESTVSAHFQVSLVQTRYQEFIIGASVTTMTAYRE